MGLLLLPWTMVGPLTYAQTVVYDNTSTPTSGYWAPNGFWPFSYYSPYEPTGYQVNLSGTDRLVTRFDLLLSSSQPTTITSISLGLYMPDGYDGDGFQWAPGTLLWSGTSTDVSVNGLTTLTFSVPRVAVPDTFIWVIRADSNVAGLATFNPPTVGSSDDYYWDLDGPSGQWWAQDFSCPPDYTTQSPYASFGAEIWAVPEPATGSLLALGLLGLLRRRAHGT